METKRKQRCNWCDEPTGRCGEDDLVIDLIDSGPLCEECYDDARHGETWLASYVVKINGRANTRLCREVPDQVATCTSEHAGMGPDSCVVHPPWELTETECDPDDFPPSWISPYNPHTDPNVHARFEARLSRDQLMEFLEDAHLCSSEEAVQDDMVARLDFTDASADVRSNATVVVAGVDAETARKAAREIIEDYK